MSPRPQRGRTSTTRAQRPPTWAQTLKVWRRESGTINFLFVVAEQVEALIRIPILSAILWMALPGVYEMREALRRRKIEKARQRSAVASSPRTA
jgi:hypothetical protein